MARNVAFAILDHRNDRDRVAIVLFANIVTVDVPRVRAAQTQHARSVLCACGHLCC